MTVVINSNPAASSASANLSDANEALRKVYPDYLQGTG